MADATIAAGKRGILFDVDGTLADTVATIAAGLGDAFERFTGTRPGDEVVRGLIGMSLRDQMNLFGLGESDPDGLTERLRYTIDRFEEHKHQTTLFGPAVQAMNLVLDRGYKVALVTSKNQREIELFLNDYPEMRRATAAVCSSDVERPKPAPDSALLACERCGVRPEDALMIGDSLYDIRCAHSAGLPCVSVSYGAASAEQLQTENPAAILPTPEALLE